MKKRIMAALLAAAAVFSGCNDGAQQRQGSGLKEFADGPVTIAWNGDKKDGVQSYQANVEVYSMNSRTDTHAGLTQSYRLAVREAGGRVMSRIDFDFDDDIPFRSVISDGEEAVVFNPATEEVGYRIPLEEAGTPLYRIFGGQSAVSRINLSLIRQEAQRLSLNMAEDAGGGTLLLELPPAMIPGNGSDRIVRSRASFNIADETLLETEVVMVREDETVVTTTVTPVYEDAGGVPVKVGMITVIDSKAPGPLEGVDPDTPAYSSPDDIPDLDEGAFASMAEAGVIHEVTDMTFGDPADTSYVETVYEVYRDITINAAPESLFRLIQK